MSVTNKPHPQLPDSAHIQGDRNTQPRIEDTKEVAAVAVTDFMARQPDAPPEERIIAETIIPPRFPEVTNQILRSEGYTLFVPDPEVMTALARINPKISMFEPAHIPPKSGTKEGWYGDAITYPAVEAAQKAFPNKRIAVRGVPASINGTITIGNSAAEGFQFQDIAFIAERGTNSPLPSFNVITHQPDGPRGQHHMPSKYLYEVDGKRFGQDELHYPLFPALLVYDQDLLIGDGGPHQSEAFGVTAKDGYSNADALLAAYVLPITDYAEY